MYISFKEDPDQTTMFCPLYVFFCLIVAPHERRVLLNKTKSRSIQEMAKGKAMEHESTELILDIMEV